MRLVLLQIGALIMTFVFAVSPVPAQQPPASVNRLEIYNGPVRYVSYTGQNLSLREKIALHDFQFTENEMTLADMQQRLRMQYVNDESFLEARRRTVQQLSYGGYGPGCGSPRGAWGGGYWSGWGGGVVSSLANDHTAALSRLSPRVRAALDDSPEEAIPAPVPAPKMGLRGVRGRSFLVFGGR